jgi:hypothetical protein
MIGPRLDVVVGPLVDDPLRRVPVVIHQEEDRARPPAAERG